MTDVLPQSQPIESHIARRNEAVDAAKTAAHHINNFVDGLLGTDEAGDQITFGQKAIPVEGGTYNVERFYDKRYLSTNTRMTFTPEGDGGPTVQLTMQDSMSSDSPNFSFYARERDLAGGPQTVDQFYFIPETTYPNLEELHRAEQFAAQVMAPLMSDVPAV